MKKRNFIIVLVALAGIFSSCSDAWDDYMGGISSGKGQGVSNVPTTVLNQTVEQFIASDPKFSRMYTYYTQTGSMPFIKSDRPKTLWIAPNDSLTAYYYPIEDAVATKMDTTTVKFSMNSLAFRPTDLYNNLQLISASGVFLNITITDTTTFVNRSRILHSYILKDGVVHLLNRPVVPELNIFDYLVSLDSEYSMIRDSILAVCERTMDMKKSIPIGTDKYGNTTYDTVWITTSELFNTVPINSESEKFTMLLPNNEVMAACFKELEERYQSGGMDFNGPEKVRCMQWIREAIFYKGLKNDTTFVWDGMETKRQLEVNSAFGRKWRKSVQVIEQNYQKDLSNGVIYNIKKLKVPNNYVIYRFKGLVNWWRYLPIDQKYNNDDYYRFKGTTMTTVNINGVPTLVPNVTTPDQGATPAPAGYEPTRYITLSVRGPNDGTALDASGMPLDGYELSVEWCPLTIYTNQNTGFTEAKKIKIPAGEYTLSYGAHASTQPAVDIYFWSGDDSSGEPDLLMEKTCNDLTSPWHYDRVNNTQMGIAKWDGSGGVCGVVTIGEEDGQAASFRMRAVYREPSTSTLSKNPIYPHLDPYHWCLMPTANNY